MGSVKVGEFLEQLTDYQLLKDKSAPITSSKNGQCRTNPAYIRPRRLINITTYRLERHIFVLGPNSGCQINVSISRSINKKLIKFLSSKRDRHSDGTGGYSMLLLTQTEPAQPQLTAAGASGLVRSGEFLDQSDLPPLQQRWCSQFVRREVDERKDFET